MNLFDTLDNKRKNVNLAENQKIKIYVCGITPYSESHIGHAMSAVIFDTLRKYLLANKQNVTYVQNFTDIDDKLIKAAEENNTDIKTISTKFINKHLSALSKLNVLEPDYSPKATEEIKEMINMIQTLISKGMAYEIDGDCFFRVEKFETYGKLSKRNFDEMLAGARIEIDERKENPMDFALWKTKTGSEPGWESPWGEGRPGWHIECSAMSMKYLGQNIDIHGGGRDLIFPHHENEIAQSRCANDTDIFANYWVHNGFITISNEKMAKSQGNILKINDFKKNINGQVLRLALISAHYKQPLDWNDKLLDECKKILNKWYDCYVEVKNKVLIPEDSLEPLYDDLNTPGYIANIHKLYDKAQNGSDEDKEIFTTACNFIGLLTDTKDQWLKFKKEKSNISEEEILSKIKERDKARKNKDYKLSDKIRDELLNKGVLIEDKDGKTTWKLKRAKKNYIYLIQH